MDALAIIIEAPRRVAFGTLELISPGPSDLVIESYWSGISSGTEKLLWAGEMPSFPGMGYPLVPGYETVGRVVDAGRDAKSRIGDWVFVPGANCYVGARGLFGGTARKLVVPSARAFPISESLGANGILIALAATAHHALAGGSPPDLIVGHGVLGRLLARLTIAAGAPPPVVWDNKDCRRSGACGYQVIAPKDDTRADYRSIYDVSGFADGIDTLIAKLGKRGEIVLAGFYANRINFAFAPAFQAEARLRVATEWAPEDMENIRAMIESGALNLDGLISDIECASQAARAYPDALTNPECLKMVLDWREIA